MFLHCFLSSLKKFPIDLENHWEYFFISRTSLKNCTRDCLTHCSVSDTLLGSTILTIQKRSFERVLQFPLSPCTWLSFSCKTCSRCKKFACWSVIWEQDIARQHFRPNELEGTSRFCNVMAPRNRHCSGLLRGPLPKLIQT